MYIIQRLYKEDIKLANAICESLKTAYDPAISKFFVHQDLAYKSFFKSTIEHPSYATYYCYDSESDELQGFACFQFIGEIIFLKHIVVNNKLRGSRIGTSLLYKSLDLIQKDGLSNGELFQLHVFESNSRALSWYLSIGMEALDCSYWYDLYPHTVSTYRSALKRQNFLTMKADAHGFMQANYNGLHVGTFLNNRTLLIKDSQMLELFPIFPDFIRLHAIESIGFISNKQYDFELVDKSFLMSMPVTQLKLTYQRLLISE